MDEATRAYNFHRHPFMTASGLQTHVSPVRVAQARRGLLVFAVTLLPLSIFGYWYAVEGGTSMLLAFTPAVASIIARLVLREGFGDVSFRIGGGRTLQAVLIGIALPLIVGLLAYGAVWAFGIAAFNPAAIPSPFPSPEDPVARFALTILLALTVGAAFFLPTAAGEEIGWRGYMLTRLIEAGVPRPLLTSGLIWSSWHLPLILMGAYSEATGGGSAWLAALGFMVAATTAAFVFGWLRLGSGSVWPAVIAHAVWNAVTQIALNLAVEGENAYLWIGESGLLVWVVLVGTAVVINRFWRYARPGMWRQSVKEPFDG